MASVLLASTSHTQPCGHHNTIQLVPQDGEAFDEFGFAVSVTNDTAVIGVPWDDDNGTDSGSAYIYRFDGAVWVEEANLLPTDGAVDDRFGLSVSVSGNTVVVGAPTDDDNGTRSGSAYVFRHDGEKWAQQDKLLPDDAEDGDVFGGSVCISGDTIVIGAVGDDDNGLNSGSAYVYRYDGAKWTQQAKLLPDDGKAVAVFGHSVSVSGETVLIGARFDGDNSTAFGAAYVYHYDGTLWVQQAKLTASDRARRDNFGHSVSISGNTAVIGARGDDDNGTDSGSAYIFRFDGTKWAEEAKLVPTDGANGDQFGSAVSISDHIAVIAAETDENGFNAGSAYVFRFDGTQWIEETKLLPADGSAGDLFGSSVSISANTVLIGVKLDNNNEPDSGSANVYNLCRPCSPDVNGDGKLDLTDFDAWIAAYNTATPECDQNGDGLCTPTDFTAWIANFNAGCG